jgi:hypothetical protein
MRMGSKDMGEHRAGDTNRRPEYGRGGVLYRVHAPHLVAGCSQRCDRIGCERSANTLGTLSRKL